ncbi:hypothetical protein ACFTXB_03840 [Streptomyces sp. NPDC057074]|uniref:hypothetical protein n=1 Tax=Streptomyces sp. NPDC057074 TaxID=3346015 RepID=UPI00362F9BF6
MTTFSGGADFACGKDGPRSVLFGVDGTDRSSRAVDPSGAARAIAQVADRFRADRVVLGRPAGLSRHSPGSV